MYFHFQLPDLPLLNFSRKHAFPVSNGGSNIWDVKLDPWSVRIFQGIPTLAKNFSNSSAHAQHPCKKVERPRGIKWHSHKSRARTGYYSGSWVMVPQSPLLGIEMMMGRGTRGTCSFLPDETSWHSTQVRQYSTTSRNRVGQ